MTARRQILFWVAALAIFVVFLLVFSSILLPFVAGAALAYALDPIADWFERRGLTRLAATLTILVLFLLVLVLAFVLLIPALVDQLGELIRNIPAYFERLRSLAVSLVDGRLARFFGFDPNALRASMGNLTSQAASWLATIAGSVWSGGMALINILSLFVVTPVVAFYLLYDWDRTIARVDSWLPRDHADEIRQLAREMDATIAAFVRGQVLVCLTLGAFYAIGLAAIGLNYGLLIGIIAGLLSFIPFIGFAVGFVLSLGVALVQFAPSWIWVAATVGVFLVGQALEGYVLQPRLIGGRVGLHPVWILFSLFAFGYLFGLVGLMIAIPAAAAVGVLVRYGLAQYLASPIYRGSDGKTPR